jgi:hypothetical protein
MCCVGYPSSSAGDGCLMRRIPCIVGLVGVVIPHDICSGLDFLSSLVMYLIKLSVSHSIAEIQLT